jgi:hypothetical protein
MLFYPAAEFITNVMNHYFISDFSRSMASLSNGKVRFEGNSLILF